MNCSLTTTDSDRTVRANRWSRSWRACGKPALEVEEGAPLMLVERTAYSMSGRPLEYARDRFGVTRTRVVVWTICRRIAPAW